MTAEHASPVEIRRGDGREIHVAWDDGHRSVFSSRALREACPCAACVNEFTGARMLDPATIPPDIRAEALELVGRYAVRMRWSDGHSTGIYPFDKLREWCPCDACRAG